MEPKEGSDVYNEVDNGRVRPGQVDDGRKGPGQVDNGRKRPGQVDSRRVRPGQVDKKGNFSTEYGVGTAASLFPAFPSKSSVRTTWGG